MENAKTICIEMLQQRGYKLCNDAKVIKAEKSGGDFMVVYFHDAPKLNIKDMSKYMTMMNDEGVNHSIIVFMDSVTSMTSKSIDQSIDMKMELFSMEELQINITKHRLQPSRFDRLGKAESLEFRKKYGSKFPIMKFTDPIARFYDYEKGDNIEITQRNGLVNFRIVN